MKELFWIASPGELPVPCLDAAADGTPREPDDITYFDLDAAAQQSGMTVETLRRAFAHFIREQMAIGELPASLRNGSAVGEPRFVSAEAESGPESRPFDDGSKLDLTHLHAGDLQDRVRRRMAGISPVLYAEFEAQMKLHGYDILRRDCYPVVQWNPETKRNEVFCCATLGMVEQQMLQSGLFGGWVGPTLYGGADGELKTIWLSDEPPLVCQVTLTRIGTPDPCVILVEWNEVAQYTVDSSGKKRTRILTQFWRERPKLALEKCAKMKAIRTLFRDFVGAVYVREELPSLSQRHLNTLPERSTTRAGHRHRTLPQRGSSSGSTAAINSPAFDIETVRTEVDARLVMRARGLLHDFMVNKVIEQARKERGLLEKENPEQFWGYTLDLAARRFGMRR